MTPPKVAPVSKKEVSAEAIVPDENILSDRMRTISIKDNVTDAHGPTAAFSNDKDDNISCDNDLNSTVILANSSIIASMEGRPPMILGRQSQKIYFCNETPVSKKFGLAFEEGTLTSENDCQTMMLGHRNPDSCSDNGTEDKDFALSINKHRVSFTPEGSPSKFEHKRNISDLSTTETLIGNDTEDKENEDDSATPTKHTVQIASLQAQIASLTTQLHAAEKANAASRTEVNTLKAAGRRQRLDICNLNRSLQDAHEKHPSHAPQPSTRATHADEITSLNAAHATELASLKTAHAYKLAALEARAAKAEALATRVHELGEQQYQRAERLQAAGEAEWARANDWQARYEALAATAHSRVSSPAATRVVESVVARINARLGDILKEVRAEGGGGVGLVLAQEKAVMEPLEGVFETDARGEARRGVELEGMFEFLAKRGQKFRDLGTEVTEEEVLSAMRRDEEKARVVRMENDVFAAVRRDNENIRRMRAAER